VQYSLASERGAFDFRDVTEIASGLLESQNESNLTLIPPGFAGTSSGGLRRWEKNFAQ
jgi:hypothetical protein